MAEPRPRSSWKRKLFALSLSILVATITAEIMVRVLIGVPLAERLPIMMMQANPHRGWMMAPGVDHYTYQHLVEVNAHGLRGAEIGAKAEGTMRVLALGDSLVYGQGVGEAETLPAYLQEILTERDPQGRRWEVINGGHRGYHTLQEIGLFEELGAELQADVVVLFWFWNDLSENDIVEQYEALSKMGVVSFDTHDTVEGWARVRWQLTEWVRRSALVMFVHDARKRLEETPWPQKMFDDGLARLGPYLGRLKAQAATLNCRPVFVAIPDANLLIGEHQSAAPSAKALGLAGEKELAPLDLLPAMLEFSNDGESLPVIPYDGHYLPEANRAMAEAVADHLLK